MRFVDETGKTFFVQRGGDQFVDPTWNDDINMSLKNPAPDRAAHPRLRDGARGRRAVRARRAARARAVLVPRAVYAARPAPAERSGDDQEGGRHRGVRPTDTGYATAAFGGSWWFEGDLYDKNTSCVFWYCPAKHSSVALWAYQTSWQLA